MLFRSGGLPVDLTLAFTWYKRAADLGLALSHGPVSDAYRQGRGVEKNERLALTYLERGVAAGDGYSLWRMGTVVQAGALGLAQARQGADHRTGEQQSERQRGETGEDGPYRDVLEEPERSPERFEVLEEVKHVLVEREVGPRSEEHTSELQSH